MNTTAVQNHTPNTIAVNIGNAFTNPPKGNRASFIHIADTPMTMSSVIIAKLTEKRHDHVLRDISIMLSELYGEDGPNFGGIYLDSYNREKRCFNLPRREVDILLSGYSTKMRAAVVDRWRELEAEKKLGTLEIPNNFAGALKLAFTLEEERSMLAYQVKTLEQQAAEDVEKVEFYDDMADTSKLFGVDTVAKTLGTGPVRLFSYMRDHKILKSNQYRFNEPYQKHVEAGRFQVKWGKYKNKVTGEFEHKPTTFFTGKGVIWIEQFIAEHGRNEL